MSEYLPYGEFKWLKYVDGFDVNSINKKRDTGYFLEVDLEYPSELHNSSNLCNYIMIIHLLQKNLLLLMTCFQNIVKKFLMNMT